MIELVHDAGDHLTAADDAAGDDVGVAVQVLGAAVHLHIETVLQRAEVHRRGKGVVDDGHQSVATRELDDRLQIGHLQQRIGHRLHVESPGRLRQLLCPGLGPVAGDKVAADPQLGHVFGGKAVSSTVQAVLGQEVVARLQESEQCRGDRRHARARHHGVLAAGNRGQLVVQGQVVGTVVEAEVADLVVRGFSPTAGIGGALENRQDDGALHLLLRIAGVNELGLHVAKSASRHKRYFSSSLS